VIVFIEATLLEEIREAVKPLLRRYGGVGFVSAAETF
jgi:hypothetical protein